jgi:protein-S-isoprenylcysteine O-methyltransferase Ste14
MRRFLERGGGWVVAQILLFSCVFVLALWYRGTLGQAWRYCGIALLVAGSLIAVLGARMHGRKLSPFPKPPDGGTLIRHGIYGKIRHPLYTAVILAGLGWALAWGSWPSALAAAVLMPFLHAKSLHEERLLRERYREYRDYEAHTKRFIPWIY